MTRPRASTGGAPAGSALAGGLERTVSLISVAGHATARVLVVGRREETSLYAANGARVPWATGEAPNDLQNVACSPRGAALVGALVSSPYGDDGETGEPVRLVRLGERGIETTLALDDTDGDVTAWLATSMDDGVVLCAIPEADPGRLFAVVDAPGGLALRWTEELSAETRIAGDSGARRTGDSRTRGARSRRGRGSRGGASSTPSTTSCAA